jgi:hypothetical protein
VLSGTGIVVFAFVTQMQVPNILAEVRDPLADRRPAAAPSVLARMERASDGDGDDGDDSDGEDGGDSEVGGLVGGPRRWSPCSPPHARPRPRRGILRGLTARPGAARAARPG